ncbi:5-hydroxytryptamine receptor 1-like [Paramuricea clavata]|uniref:5-hydroxytryptamine receptor 1-like n=1 Tax=Paramuricea clavata TaxID=317549 RepID=A0A7D9HJR2_PARCT|nr:5-hydroxytryptamine receptor 1-like [Paramuricea clavata]
MFGTKFVEAIIALDKPSRSSFAAMFPNQTGMDTWNESDWTKYIEFLKQIELGEEIMLIFIAILTTLGNSLVLVATWREESLHQPNKYFIAFLAVADLVVGSYGIVLMNTNLKYCPGDDSKERGFYTLLAVVFIISTVIILVMYTLIFVAAHKRQIMLRNGELGQTWNDQNQRSVFRQDLKVIRMLFVVLGMFILCWFLFVIFNLLEFYDPSSIDWDSTSLSCQYSIHISRTIVSLLPLLNSLCNPIIYACLDQKYREAFKSLFQRMMCRPSLGRRQLPSESGISRTSGVEFRPARTR